jgi:Rrf2 family protein
MAHLTVSVEYGIHCLLWLADFGDAPLSSRDLAALQGISRSFLAKIFPKLERAGIVRASEGARGGYLLAKPPHDISFLEIVDAIEGKKPLFDCRNIRVRCALFRNKPPAWAAKGFCSIHTVVLRAETSMRDTLAGYSLGDLAHAFAQKAPDDFPEGVRAWLDNRVTARARKPTQAKNTDRPTTGGRRRIEAKRQRAAGHQTAGKSRSTV